MSSASSPAAIAATVPRDVVAKPRVVVKQFESVAQMDGEGAAVRRSIGRPELKSLDPFLMCVSQPLHRAHPRTHVSGPPQRVQSLHYAACLPARRLDEFNVKAPGGAWQERWPGRVAYHTRPCPTSLVLPLRASALQASHHIPIVARALSPT